MDESDVEEDLDFGPISEETAYLYTVQTVTHLQSQHPNTSLQVGSNLDFLPLQLTGHVGLRPLASQRCKRFGNLWLNQIRIPCINLNATTSKSP